jgi:dual specificity tyrosine-phosphorylation-regulated kinase 2/3/4
VRGKRTDTFFNAENVPKHIVDRKGRTRAPSSRPLTSAIGSTDPAFVDFITKCLTWDVESRLTPEDAMQHPFIRSLEASSLGRPSALSTPAVSDPASSQENQPPGPNGKEAATGKKGRMTMGINWPLKSRVKKA